MLSIGASDVDELVPNLLLFARVLRRIGIDVHHDRAIDAIRAVETTGIRSRTDVRAALAALLIVRREDRDRFDAAFDLFFRAPRTGSSNGVAVPFAEPPRLVARPRAGTAATIESADHEGATGRAATLAVAAYSAADVSRTKDFSDFTDAELDAAARLMERFPWRLGIRRTRRWRRAPHGEVDLRPLVRRHLMHGAELIDLPRRRRREAPRPLVVLGDVSGSMDRYSRVLLHFVAGLARGGGRVESFLFATRLTRITPRVAGRPTARRLARVVRDVQDWGGGTRIGDALRTFNTRWARRVMRHGPIVIILSDGWDRGDPSLLSRELERVRRSCKRVVWLNPLLGSATYEPLTRGMQAALRHVDDFLPAHNLASLEDLASHLRTLGR